jgi:hypothetical protein
MLLKAVSQVNKTYPAGLQEDIAFWLGNHLTRLNATDVYGFALCTWDCNSTSCMYVMWMVHSSCGTWNQKRLEKQLPASFCLAPNSSVVVDNHPRWFILARCSSVAGQVSRLCQKGYVLAVTAILRFLLIRRGQLNDFFFRNVQECVSFFYR